MCPGVFLRDAKAIYNRVRNIFGQKNIPLKKACLHLHISRTHFHKSGVSKKPFFEAFVRSFSHFLFLRYTLLYFSSNECGLHNSKSKANRNELCNNKII